MEISASKKVAVPFYNIPAGKLRRYFALRNFTDPFRTVVGIIKAWFLLGKLKPQVILSKGGFISFPVVIAGWLRHIPIIAHESDIVPGLTTRLCLPFITKQCLGFVASKKYFTKHLDKLVVTGIPLRSEILHGTKEKGLRFLGIPKQSKPILLVLGGSSGAKKLNEVITQSFAELNKQFIVIHMTGLGKKTHEADTDYFPFESFSEELADIYQCADIIISRAGATTLAEILTLGKPAILIPLGKDQSRGDQIINAQTFTNLPQIRVVLEEHLNEKSLFTALSQLQNQTIPFAKNAAISHSNATKNVINVLQSINLESKI